MNAPVRGRLDRRLSIAPMMDRTDRHCRYFLRLLSKHTLLYSEMVTSAALTHGDTARLLEFHPAEKPLALQLGGCDPAELGECARIAEGYGFDEVNLNVGCPSPRVQQGRFGACLMAEPERVADCVAAMNAATSLPVTVKTRIGVDELDRYQDLTRFVTCVSESGCSTFIVHARKAWLSGLSPRENREIPPLRYDVVERLKADFPSLEIVLNGGVQSLEQVKQHLATVDGVMIGRAAYQSPYLLADADREVFGSAQPAVSREACMEAWLPYVERELSRGTSLHAMVRHTLGLYHGVAGGRRWRRYLSEQVPRSGAGVSTLLAATEKCFTASG